MSQLITSTKCTSATHPADLWSLSHLNGVIRVPVVGAIKGGRIIAKEHCQVIVIQPDGSWAVHDERIQRSAPSLQSTRVC